MMHCGDLVKVAEACRLPTTLRLISRCLAEEIENHPDALNDLLGVVAKRTDDQFRQNCADGSRRRIERMASRAETSRLGPDNELEIRPARIR